MCNEKQDKPGKLKGTITNSHSLGEMGLEVGKRKLFLLKLNDLSSFI